MKSYEGFENIDIRWNGWFIMMNMEVPAVFGMGLNPKLLIKTAAV